MLVGLASRAPQRLLKRVSIAFVSLALPVQFHPHVLLSVYFHLVRSLPPRDGFAFFRERVEVHAFPAFADVDFIMVPRANNHAG